MVLNSSRTARLAIVILTLAIWLSLSSNVSAVILDQSVPDGNASFGINFTVAQTFTVGRSGGLSALEFLLSSPSNSNPTGITFAIARLNPDGSPLDDWESQAVEIQHRVFASQSRRWERFEFAPIPVVA